MTTITQENINTVKIFRYPNFNSKYIPSRNIDIILPPNYSESLKYPVIYMHDGQNLFDPSTSFIGVDWGIDETINRLVNQNKIRPVIVVGIWNNGERISEYMPQKAYEKLSKKKRNFFDTYCKDKFGDDILIYSDNYLKFIVEELKPFIDSSFNTITNCKNTFVMGSSMGGLISAYAMSEYPNIFGGAACLSTHWLAGDGVMIDYLKTNLPSSENHKFYFDYGTKTLDAEYEPYQKKMDRVMKKQGYEKGKNWITEKFEDAEHSERAWRERAYIPISFLLNYSE